MQQNAAGAGAMGSLTVVIWGFLMMVVFPFSNWLGSIMCSIIYSALGAVEGEIASVIYCRLRYPSLCLKLRT